MMRTTLKRALGTLLLAGLSSTLLFANGAADKATTGKAAKTTKISLIHYMGEKQKKEGLQTLIDGYRALHPEVSFEVTAIETSNYLTTLKTMIAAGDTPDIIFGKPKEYTDLIDAGHLADMTGAPFVSNLAPGAVPSVVYKGKVYGLPVDLQSIGIFYNKKVFADNGVKIPTTWSELIAGCEKFKAAGIAPFAHPYKDSWTVFVDFFADEYVVRADYPDMYEQIEAGKKSFADYPHFKDLLQRIRTRASYGSGDDWGTDNGTAQNMMATGKAAMYINGSWAIGDFLTNFPDASIGYFPVPSTDDPAKNKLPVGVDDAWMASAGSEHMDVVLDFFKYISTPEAAVAWMKATKTISLSANTSGYSYDPISMDIVRWLDSGKVTNFHAPMLFSSALEDVYRNMIVEAVASSTQDLDTLVKEFDKRINEVR